jgi:hypothetical protein
MGFIRYEILKAEELKMMTNISYVAIALIYIALAVAHWKGF